MFMRIAMGRSDAGFDEAIELSAKLDQDLILFHFSTYHAPYELRKRARKFSVAVEQATHLLRICCGLASEQNKMATDIETGSILQARCSVFKRGTCSHHRRTRDYAALMALYNPGIDADRHAIIIRVYN